MKKLIVSACLIIASTKAHSQLYIGVSDKAILEYFPKAEVHKVKMGDSLAILVLADDVKSVFWYDIHRQMVTSYSVNPIDRGLFIQLTDNLSKDCFIVKPEKEWSCKKQDFIIEVTEKPEEGPHHTIVNTLNYKLVK